MAGLRLLAAPRAAAIGRLGRRRCGLLHGVLLMVWPLGVALASALTGGDATLSDAAGVFRRLLQQDDATKARNFHFAHIDWKMCRDTKRDGVVIPGFYDPAFPEVCAGARDDSDSARKTVGFTVHCQWPNGAQDALSMLKDYSNQITNFRDNCGGAINYQQPCYLSVLQGSDPEMQRKIGWRKGLGDDSISSGGGFVQSAATSSRDYEAGTYNFVIERESQDFRTVHARFSFEIEFSSKNEYYSVFFEGCCRPAALKNNAGLVFHVRSEVFVNSDSRPEYPLSSFKFSAPTEVILKREGPGACNQLSCSPSKCTIDFQLQGFHEQPEWHEKTYFRLATLNEMGKYKCMVKLDEADPESLLQFNPSGRCPSGQTASSFLQPSKLQMMDDTMDSKQPLSNARATVAGVVQFDVSLEAGVYSAGFAAYIQLDNGVTLSQVLDTKVEVAVLPQNDQPTVYVPLLDDARNVESTETPVSILSGASDPDDPSYPTKASPLEIQCGLPFFFFGKVGAQKANGAPRDLFDAQRNAFGQSIEFAYKDPDFQRRSGGDVCLHSGQTIQFIDAANMLPRGLNISATKQYGNGVAKVEIKWTPVCEDRSQIGLFKLCFYAKDEIDSDGFKPTYSVPSPWTSKNTWEPVDPETTDEVVYAPSCIYIDSKAPARNLPPVLSTKDPQTGQRIIEPVQCGTVLPANAQGGAAECRAAGWPMDGTDGFKVGNQYVLGCTESSCGQKYELVVAAESENDFTKTDVAFSFPDSKNVDPAIFALSGPKYNCSADESFEACQSNPQVRRRVSRKLTVNIRPNMESPIRVCYQGFQETPTAVNLQEWQNLYGEPPTSKSQVTCFMLNIINSPIWPSEYIQKDVFPAAIKVSVGQTERIKLTARNLGSGSTMISILADPGAPEGARLLEQTNIGSDSSRFFEYTPSVAQAGLQSTVCFTASTQRDGSASDAAPVDSVPFCYKFEVVIEAISWQDATPCPFDAGTGYIPASTQALEECRPQGIKIATVGCRTTSELFARRVATTLDEPTTVRDKYYDYKLRIQRYPSCCNCYDSSDDDDDDVVSSDSCEGTGSGASHISVFKCNETVTSSCCGDGVCNGAESGIGCPEDCKTPDDASINRVNGTEKWRFTFSPQRHQQGRDLLMCVEAYTDVAGTAVVLQKRSKNTAPSLCVVSFVNEENRDGENVAKHADLDLTQVFRVESCRYCVPAGATLTSIARHYLLNMDWLYLYNANPDVKNPDHLLMVTGQNQKIHVGPLYSVAPGDTLVSVAATMKTTVKKLLENNPQISDNGLLDPSDKICVIPCSAPS